MHYARRDAIVYHSYFRRQTSSHCLGNAERDADKSGYIPHGISVTYIQKISYQLFNY